MELLGPLAGTRRAVGEQGWMASSTVASATLSWRLAPVRTTARGRPFRSTTMCRLGPGLPRSAGFGPIASPPFWRAPTKRPRWRATGRSPRRSSGAPACGDGSHPTGRHPGHGPFPDRRGSRHGAPILEHTAADGQFVKHAEVARRMRTGLEAGPDEDAVQQRPGHDERGAMGRICGVVRPDEDVRIPVDSPSRIWTS